VNRSPWRGFRRTRRVRMIIAVVTALALPVLTATSAQAQSAAPGAGTLAQRSAVHAKAARPVAARTARPISQAIPHAAAMAAASAAAAAASRPVIVPADTTETSVTVANPDGTFTRTISVLPVRVSQHGRWVPVSAALRPAGGRLRPAAVPSALTLSGGGSGPLAVLSSPAGGSLSVWFPARLPAPRVSGATATYPSVLPGVSLRVTATTLGGITEVIVLSAPTATERRLLTGLAMRFAARGLHVSADRAGNLMAAGPGDTAEFSGPPAVISGRPGPGSRAAGGAAAAARRTGAPAGLVRYRVSDGAIAMPAAAGLRFPASAYPLTLTADVTPDVTMRPAAGAAPAGVARSALTAAAAGLTDPMNSSEDGYVETEQGTASDGTNCATIKNWNVSQPVGATSYIGNGIGDEGFGPYCIGVDQSYYRFDTSGLVPAMHVISATLTATETYGAVFDCNDSWQVNLYSLSNGLGVIGPFTNEQNEPQLDSSNEIGHTTVNAGPNPNSSCPQRTLQFDVTSDMAKAAANSYAYWNYGFQDNDTSDEDYFMRLGNGPSISTTFDVTPPAPAYSDPSPVPQDHPGQTDMGCGSTTPWIGATNSVTLKADFEPSSDLPNEEIKTNWSWSNPQTSGSAGPSDNEGHGTYTYQIPTLTDGDTYTWQAGTTVDDNGASGDGGYTTWGSTCSFTLDMTPPTDPVVTSSVFPPSGSSPGTTQTAPGAAGTFSFSSTDPLPAGCLPGHLYIAGTCQASGVYEFEYSLNQPLPSNIMTTQGCTGGQDVALLATTSGGTATATSCTVDVNQWGTNILYVDAIDNAGNVSQSQYEFYVPWNPQTKVTPGDVNGDGIPDLLATTTTGNLVMFPGGTDPGNGPQTASVAADAPGYSTFGDGWNDFYITHRGSWSGGSVDDLLALDKKEGDLYRYNNSGTPTGMFENPANVVTMNYPPCGVNVDPDNASNCSGYPASGWSAYSQILAPGDAWAGAPPDPLGETVITDDSGLPSMLAVDASTGSLWLFQGSGGQLINPIQLGASGWNDVTIMAPGSVDGQNTLWARVNTGADAGEIFSFPFVVPSGHVPTLDPSAPGTLVTPTSGTPLASGSGDITISPTTYPTVTSTGALTGGTCGTSDLTACPGLYAEDGSGGLWFFPGQPTTTAAGALTGTSQLVAGATDAIFSWPLNEGTGTTADDATGNGHSGTLSSGVSWAVDPTRGNVPLFNGTSGAVTSSSGGSLIPTGLDESFSVSAWEYVMKAGGWQDAVTQDGTEASCFNLGYASNGDWVFRMPSSDVTDAPTSYAYSPTAAPLDTWAFLTGTYDASTGILSLYVNGQLAATSTDPTPYSTTGPTAVGRGQWNGGDADWLDGYVSQVEGFGYALNASQVQDLYNSSLLTQLS
jgi:hypothetical protein